MDKLCFVLALSFLFSLTFADCDHTGCLAGSVQRVEVPLSNVSGLFNQNANCTMRVWDSLNVSVLNVKMLSHMDGRFYYDWTIPTEPGVYSVLFNCTDSLKANYTNGGSVFVAPRSFEKAVAHAQVTFVERYEEIAEVQPDNQNWMVLLAGFALVVLGIVLGTAYSKMGK